MMTVRYNAMKFRQRYAERDMTLVFLDWLVCWQCVKVQKQRTFGVPHYTVILSYPLSQNS
jgi:hypothetical protein